MDLSIAVVSWNTRELLDQCLKSIYDTSSGIEVETIVVDNASTDGSAEMVRVKYSGVKLIENTGNVGFAKANNQAFEVSSGRYFLLLNPDTICLPGALPDLVSFLDRNPKTGAVGPLVLNSDRTLQYSWAKFPGLLSEAFGKLDRRIESSGLIPKTAEDLRTIDPFETDWIGGCCLMIRREAVEQVGLMDESFFMYNEETDWCYRLNKAGWGVCVDPQAEIVHLGGQSSEQVPVETRCRLAESKLRFFAKHYGRREMALLNLMLTSNALVRGVTGSSMKMSLSQIRAQNNMARSLMRRNRD